MTKATITFEDDAETGEVRVAIDFDPPLSDDVEPSHAVNMTVAAIEHLQESYGVGKEHDNE